MLVGSSEFVVPGPRYPAGQKRILKERVKIVPIIYKLNFHCPLFIRQTVLCFHVKVHLWFNPWSFTVVQGNHLSLVNGIKWFGFYDD